MIFKDGKMYRRGMLVSAIHDVGFFSFIVYADGDVETIDRTKAPV